VTALITYSNYMKAGHKPLGRGGWVVKQMALALVLDACFMKRLWQMH